MSVVADPVPITSNPLAQKRWMNLCALGLIALGIFTRLRIYLADRSMWRDEAALALNVMHRSAGGLFGALDYNQGAPVGFLMIQKFATSLLGSGEMAFRLWPMTASILAIPLFYLLCRELLSPRAAIVALAILSLSTDVSFYWTEAKQYSTDVLISICLLLVAARSFGHDENRLPAATAWMAVAGILAVWFSQPALFVLGGILLAMIVEWRGEKSLQYLKRAVVLALAWGVAFALVYFLNLRDLSNNQYLHWFWGVKMDAFAPLPTSIAALRWYHRSVLELFRFLCSDYLEILGALMCFVGAWSLWKARKTIAVLLLTPGALAMIASGMRLYPFGSRLALFLDPMLIIMIAAGIEYLWQQGITVLAIPILILLMVFPVSSTAINLKSPELRCDMRDAVAFAAAHRAPGDVFYIFPTAQYDFLYYQPRFGLDDIRLYVGARKEASAQYYSQELRELDGKRAWVIYENAFNGDPSLEPLFAVRQPVVLDILDAMGPCLWKAKPFNEYVACYDLTHRPVSMMKTP
jgi:predicted small integral membrane protein